MTAKPWAVSHRTKREYLLQNVEAAGRGEVHAQRRLLAIFANTSPEDENFDVFATYFLGVVREIGAAYEPFSPAMRKKKLNKAEFAELQRSALAKLGLKRAPGRTESDPEIEGIYSEFAAIFIPMMEEKHARRTRVAGTPRARAIAEFARIVGLSEKKVAAYVARPRARLSRKGLTKSN